MDCEEEYVSLKSSRFSFVLTFMVHYSSHITWTIIQAGMSKYSVLFENVKAKYLSFSKHKIYENI